VIAHLDLFNHNNLGFAAIFMCISLGFFFLRNVDKKEKAILIWAMSFAMNSIGFIFWSDISVTYKVQMFILGEVFHMSGFITLVYGAYRFFGHKMNRKVAIMILICFLFWFFSIAMYKKHLDITIFLLRFIRSLIFIFAAVMLFKQEPKKKLIGKQIAAGSMLLWGTYILVTAIWHVVTSSVLQYGILSGFHILAAFGMVAMIVDRIEKVAEENEEKVRKLEGLLPICSYCKKIRDENNQWQVIEQYIEDRSTAAFSHGICPDCMKKYHPEYK
jgi:hypothetical protein